MGAGSFDLTGATGPLSAPVAAPYVYRYNPSVLVQTLQWLPNVVYLGSSTRVGPAPSTATFEYIQDDALNLNYSWPSRIDEIWSPTTAGPYVVQPDDRLLVVERNPDGTPNYLFDGFAQVPQADVTPQYERATFAAIGYESREYDGPISGRVQRNGDPSGIQDASGKSDVATDLPCRFNPANEDEGNHAGFRGNRTPDGYDTQSAQGAAHPVFTEDRIEGRDAEATGQYWSIADAIKYLLAEYQRFTQYPDPGKLDTLLASVYTAQLLGGQPINPGDITSDPLLLRDYDASNKPWPEAVAELLGFVGFQMRWDLQTDPTGAPVTYLRIYRADMLSGTPVKAVYLDEPGNSLAGGSPNNATRISLARDSNAIVNAWQVETGQRQVEISVYLAPLFRIAAADATLTSSNTSGRNQFKLSNLIANNADAPTRRKYRWHGADELGEGQWSTPDGAWVTGRTLDLSNVFPPDSDGTPSYTARYRPGVRKLASVDSLGRPLHARLDVAFGVGSKGGEVQPTGTNFKWFPVPGGWRLLRDRLGIEVIVEDPEDWSTGDSDLPRIGGISWWATPPSEINGIQTNGLPPLLRLTCLIEDDLRIPVSVGKRAASPTKFARWRTVDSRDHFRHTTIDLSSANYAAQGGNGTDPLVVRDDTEAATAYAYALQRAHEMPPLAGSVMMPGIVTYYEVGDRIDQISGRDIPLYRDAGLTLGESPSYPVVVGREIRCEDGFRTTIHLSDFRASREHNAY